MIWKEKKKRNILKKKKKERKKERKKEMPYLKKAMSYTRGRKKSIYINCK